MIRLTSKYTKGAFYVNPDHIISIGCNNAGDTTVELTTDIEDAVRHVTESPEEVVRKVLEWRLVIERYRAYVNSAAYDENPHGNECWKLARNAENKLMKIAGLEEQNHD